MLDYEIQSYLLTDIDIEDLVESTYNFKPNYRVVNENILPEVFIDSLQGLRKEQEEGEKILVVIYESFEKILGWILLYFEGEKSARINPWFLDGAPIVPNSEKGYEIAKLLLDWCINHRSTLVIDRLDLMYLVHRSPKGQIIDDFKILYERSKFNVVEELAHLRLDLQQQQTSDLVWDANFDIAELDNIPRDELFRVFYDIFESGEDSYYLDLDNDQEKREFFDTHFASTHALNRKASLLLYINSKVVGFSVIRHSHGENNAHLWLFGINPEIRRKGVATKFLKKIMDILIEGGMKSVSLNVDIRNSPAHNLYLKLGFTEHWIRIDRTWKVGR